MENFYSFDEEGYPVYEKRAVAKEGGGVSYHYMFYRNDAGKFIVAYKGEVPVYPFDRSMRPQLPINDEGNRVYAYDRKGEYQVYPVNPSTGDEMYGRTEDTKFPLFAANREGRPYYPLARTEEEGLFEHVTTALPTKGMLIYIHDKQCKPVCPLNKTRDRPNYPRLASGEEEYLTDANGKHFYSKDSAGNERYAVDSRGNEKLIYERESSRPIYARDRNGTEKYPRSASGAETYGIHEDSEVLAKDANGEFYYARDESGDDYYPRVRGTAATRYSLSN